MTPEDIQHVRETIARNGEFIVHLTRTRSGLSIKANLWHFNGYRVSTATGGGYDRAGASLGKAIETFFKPELQKLTPSTKNEEGQRTGLYGLFIDPANGKQFLDGACGMERMLEVLSALGFKRVWTMETSKFSSVVIATGRKVKSRFSSAARNTARPSAR